MRPTTTLSIRIHTFVIIGLPILMSAIVILHFKIAQIERISMHYGDPSSGVKLTYIEIWLIPSARSKNGAGLTGFISYNFTPRLI